MNAEQRAAVEREVLSWIGTRFVDEARAKIRRDDEGRVVDRGGVDCAHLLYGVYRAVGLVGDVPPIRYSPQFFLHRSDEDFLSEVIRMGGVEIEKPLAGDMVIYKVGRCFAHGAIIVSPGWPNIVHAVSMAGVVMRDIADTALMLRRQRKFFTI